MKFKSQEEFYPQIHSLHLSTVSCLKWKIKESFVFCTCGTVCFAGETAKKQKQNYMLFVIQEPLGVPALQQQYEGILIFVYDVPVPAITNIFVKMCE